MEKPQIFALLVAIDDYPIDRHKLNGCVNDMQAFKSFLETRFPAEQADMHIQVLPNEQATRKNIINGFENHLAKADGAKGDLAIFYYSGHGAQEPAPQEFWDDNPDKLLQSIVCWDSRINDGSDIVDKELGYLTSKVTGRAGQEPPHFLVMMDCCHSGSGTRSTGDQTKSRQMDVSTKKRKLSEYLGYEQRQESGGGIKFPVGPHVLLAAAASHQTAKETNIDGTQRGVFTHSVLKALSDAKNLISYQDLMQKVKTVVFNLVQDQSPQLEAIGGLSLTQSFLGGKISSAVATYMVTHDELDGWQVNMGILHGVPTGISGKSPASFFLFSSDTGAADLLNESKAIGITEIMDAELSHSTLSMPSNLESDTGQTYKAVVKEMATSPLKVFLEGESEGIEHLNRAFQEKTAFVQATTERSLADFCVLVKSGKYSITQLADSRPITKEVKGFNETAAKDVTNNLEHISRWKTGLEFRNPDTGYQTFPLETQVMKVLKRVGGSGAVQEETPIGRENIELQCRHVHGVFEPPSFRLKLKNTQDEPMYVAVLYFSGRFGVQPMPVTMRVTQTTHGKTSREFIFVEKLASGQEVYLLSGAPISPDLKQEYADSGLTEASDTLKVIASTDVFSVDKFKKQAGLELPVLNARSSGENRGLIDDFEEDDFNFLSGDWDTTEISVKTIKPLTFKPFSWNQSAELVSARLTINPHPETSGMASLSTAEQLGRSLHKSAFPPSVSERFSMEAIKFTQGWGSDMGLAVLELMEVKNTSEVSKEKPLTLKFDSILGDMKTAVAIGVTKTGYELIGFYSQASFRMELHSLPLATSSITENLPETHKISFIRLHLAGGVLFDEALEELREKLNALGA